MTVPFTETGKTFTLRDACDAVSDLVMGYCGVVCVEPHHKDSSITIFTTALCHPGLDFLPDEIGPYKIFFAGSRHIKAHGE